MLPTKPSTGSHVYHIYAIRVKDRDAVIATLAEKDIHCGIHYPVPLHLLEAYAFLGKRQGSFPHAEKGASEYISLPMYAELTTDQIRFVAEGLAQIVAV